MQKTRLIPGQIDHIFVGQLRLDLLVTTLPTINNIFHVNTIRCIYKVFLFQKLHVLEQQKYQHSQWTNQCFQRNLFVITNLSPTSHFISYIPFNLIFLSILCSLTESFHYLVTGCFQFIFWRSILLFHISSGGRCYGYKVTPLCN